MYLGLFIAALPAAYAANQSICESVSCLAYELTVEEVTALETMRPSYVSVWIRDRAREHE